MDFFSKGEPVIWICIKNPHTNYASVLVFLASQKERAEMKPRKGI